jgi:hypothetical protein
MVEKTDRNSQILKIIYSGHILFSSSISIIGIIVSYQGFTGKRDPINTAVILLGLIAVQQIITAIRNFVVPDRAKISAIRLLKSAKVMVPRGEFINLDVKPETNLYKNDLVPTHLKNKCVFIATVEIGEFKDAPVLLLNYTYDSKTNVYKLNKGGGLLNKGLYIFNIVAKSNECINFRFTSGGIVKKFVVEEYYVP